MNETQRSLERILEGLEPPRPPADMRVRVLAAARAALGRPALLDRWSRLLGSRPLRLAWAGAMALLALGHLLMPRGPLPRAAERSQRSAVPPLARSIGNPGDELAELVALPRIDPAARSLAELMTGESSGPLETGSGNAPADEEKRSAS